jgi:hypothetical protein
VGYLSRDDARRLQPALREYEERREVVSCSGQLVGKDILGVWLNLPRLTASRETKGASLQVGAKYDGLEVCRDCENVVELIEGRKRFNHSRPNWAGSRIAAFGEERYIPNLERVSKGRCATGERISLKVFLVPDADNPVDAAAIMVTTSSGDVLGYLQKEHALRWGNGVRGIYDSGNVVCRDAGLHQRTFKSGKRTFYLAVDMTDEDWLEDAASR